MSICYDHNGQEYKSERDMCRHYGISRSMFRWRRDRGYTLAESLGAVEFNKKSLSKKTKEERTDHKGIEYESVLAMCNAYGIKLSTYEQRRNKYGYSKEEALSKNTYVEDHLGNQYKSRKEMCEQYSIGAETYLNRLNMGWSKEKALSTPIKKKSRNVYDHLGNKFKSNREMLRYYNIDSVTFNNRCEMGWTIEEILTTPKRSYIVEDIFGNQYINIKKLAEAYGVGRKTITRNRKENEYDLNALRITGKGLKNRQGTTWNGVEILEVKDDEHIKVKADNEEFVVNNIQLAQLCLSRYKEETSDEC